MCSTRFSLPIAALAVFFTFSGVSHGSLPPSSRIVPMRGEKIRFARNYSNDFLKNHPLQLVEKASLALKNGNGQLTATWTTTIRDIRTDEQFKNLRATGVCRARSARKIECAFDSSTGLVEISAERDGLHVLIPVGQGVLFSREKDGTDHSEILLGSDDDNHEFDLEQKAFN